MLRIVLVGALAALSMFPGQSIALSTDCLGTDGDSKGLCTGRLISVIDGGTIILEYEDMQQQRRVARVRLSGWAPCAPGKCPSCDESINKSQQTIDTLKGLLGEIISFRMPTFRHDNAGRPEMTGAMVLDRSGEPVANTLIRLGLYCVRY